MERVMQLTKKVLPFLLLTIAMNFASRTVAQDEGVISVPGISLMEVPQASQNIYTTQTALTLNPHSPHTHKGSIWLRSSDDGLHIWAKSKATNKAFSGHTK